MPFSDVIKMGNVSSAEMFSPKNDDTAIIMYTSGSTGVPKGVLLSHKNILSTLKAFCDAVEIRPDDVFLGFLPLAHVFELLAESVCLLNGVPIGYSSPLTLIDSSSKIMRGSKGDASVLHPTCLSAVPVSIRLIKLKKYLLRVLKSTRSTQVFDRFYQINNFIIGNSAGRM